MMILVPRHLKENLPKSLVLTCPAIYKSITGVFIGCFESLIICPLERAKCQLMTRTFSNRFELNRWPPITGAKFQLSKSLHRNSSHTAEANSLMDQLPLLGSQDQTYVQEFSNWGIDADLVSKLQPPDCDPECSIRLTVRHTENPIPNGKQSEIFWEKPHRSGEFPKIWKRIDRLLRWLEDKNGPIFGPSCLHYPCNWLSRTSPRRRLTPMRHPCTQIWHSIMCIQSIYTNNQQCMCFSVRQE